MPTQTDETTAFLAAIRRDPADEQARLVFADWLEERDDPDGELVRLLCEVQRELSAPAVGFGCRRGENGEIEYFAKANLGEVCPNCDGLGDEPDYDTTHDDEPHAVCTVCGGAGYVPDKSVAYDRLEAVTGGLDAVIERLSERDRRLFACDCAERVLPLFEREYPGGPCPQCGGYGAEPVDGLMHAGGQAPPCPTCNGSGRVPGDLRPRRAVETARRYAWGEATDEEISTRWIDADVAAMGTSCNQPPGHAAFAAKWTCCFGFELAHHDAAEWAVNATPDPAAERRWQLCRAVEYRLGFVPLVQGSAE